jgi:hypothetical protein
MFAVPRSAQHPQHRLVGAAVQRAVERRDAAGDRRVRVDLRGADARTAFVEQFCSWSAWRMKRMSSARSSEDRART